jgi:hypothetical protein
MLYVADVINFVFFCMYILQSPSLQGHLALLSLKPRATTPDPVLKLDEVLLSRRWLELCSVGNRLPVGLIDGHRILLQKELQALVIVSLPLERVWTNPLLSISKSKKLLSTSYHPQSHLYLMDS